MGIEIQKVNHWKKWKAQIFGVLLLLMAVITINGCVSVQKSLNGAPTSTIEIPQPSVASPTQISLPTVTPTSVYSGKFSDPGIEKRFGKGIVDDVVAQNNTLAVRTENGVYVYDIEQKTELNYFSFPYSFSDVGLLNDGQYLWIDFFTTETNDEGIERIKTQGLSLWETSSGDLLWEYVAPGRINDFEINPDGKTIVISCVNYDYINRLHFIDLKTGREDVTKRIETGKYGYINYSTDGKYLIFSGQKIAVFDSETNELIAENPKGQQNTREPFLSTDGNYLVLVTRESIDNLPKFTTWVYRKNQEGNYFFHYSFFSKQGLGTEILGFIPDSNLFVINQYDNNDIPVRKIYNLDENGKEVGSIETKCDSNEMIYQFSENEFGLICITDNELIVQNITQNSIESIAKGFVHPKQMILSQDGSVLVTINWDDVLSLWDVSSGNIIEQWDLDSEMEGKATSWYFRGISQNGRVFAAQNYAQGGNQELGFWNLDTGELININPSNIGSIAFSRSDENLFYASSVNKLITSSINFEEITTIYEDPQCVFGYGGLILSNLDDEVIYGGVDCNSKPVVAMINLKEKTKTEFIIPAKYLTRYAISTDDSLLIASYLSGDEFRYGLIAINLQKNVVIFNIELRDQATTIAISPDNQYVAVGFSDPDSLTTMIDATNGKELISFDTGKSSRASVDTVLFTHDGRQLVTQTSFIDFWDISQLLN